MCLGEVARQILRMGGARLHPLDHLLRVLKPGGIDKAQDLPPADADWVDAGRDGFTWDLADPHLVIFGQGCHDGGLPFVRVAYDRELRNELSHANSSS
jgi:hypothetical protein